jgi:hypothetical protein
MARDCRTLDAPPFHAEARNRGRVAQYRRMTKAWKIAAIALPLPTAFLDGGPAWPAALVAQG